jgi:TetR/AcrR family transcriptional regulator
MTGSLTAPPEMPYAAAREESRVSASSHGAEPAARQPSRPPEPAARRPRRSPEPGERRRDAERSRERILAAATEEFAAHGFAGARVAAIAERAGVNQQLISYYFGGKQGLFDALRQQWLTREAAIADPGLPIEQVIAGYFTAGIAEPAAARLLLWQALGDSPGSTRTSEQEADVRQSVEDLRRRQRDGELTSEYDAAFIMLVTWAAAATPITLPHVIRGAYGTDPRSAEFAERFLPQLQRLFMPRPDG